MYVSTTLYPNSSRLSDALKLKRTKRGAGRKSSRYSSNDDSPAHGGHHYEVVDTPPGRLSAAVSVPMPASSRSVGGSGGGRTGVGKGKGSSGKWENFVNPKFFIFSLCKFATCYWLSKFNFIFITAYWDLQDIMMIELKLLSAQ